MYRIRFSRLASNVIVIIGCVMVGLLPMTASAATVQDITMTPSASQLAADPGGSIAGTFSVINQGDSAYSVALSVSPYHVEGDNYDPQFTQLPGTTDPSGWIKLNTTGIQQLTARKLLNVDYTLSVPAGTQPGGYYAVIFAETTPDIMPSNGVVAHSRVGNILYITVKGSVKTAGNVAGANLPKIALQSSVPLGVRIRNTGGVHFLSKTNLSVTNLFGKQVYSASLERFVLPQTERLVSGDWSAKAPFGIYRVHRSAVVAGQTQLLPTETVIVIQPVVLAGVGLIIVLLVGFVLRRKVHRKQTPGKRKNDV